VEQEHIFWHVRSDEKRKVFQNQFMVSGMGHFSAATFQFVVQNILCCSDDIDRSLMGLNSIRRGEVASVDARTEMKSVLRMAEEV
jgi:hypothetical protein